MSPIDLSLTQTRWLIGIVAGAAACMTAFGIAHDGLVSSQWTNATGSALGALGGTYAGERLARFERRPQATGLGWLQMACLALLFTYATLGSALPAYCQLPMNFAIGLVFITTIVYLRELRVR
jgi:hypothetical protein